MQSNISPDEIYIDRGWAWVILTACTAIMVFFQGNIRSFGIFVAELQKEFESSAAVVSSILSTQAIANSICSLLVLNCLSKSLPLRVLVIMGCLFSAVCFILDWQATRIELVTIFHVLNGMGMAFAYGPSMVLIGQYFVKYRGTAYALTSCGSSVGQFALSPLFSYLILEYGVKGALLVNASIFLQCITFAMLLRPTSFFHGAEIKSEKWKKLTERMLDYVSPEKNCTMGIEEENEDERFARNANGTAKDKRLQQSLFDNEVKRGSAEEISYLHDVENLPSIQEENAEDSETEIVELSLHSDTTEKKEEKQCGCFGKTILLDCKTLFTNIDLRLFKSPIFLTYFFGSSIGILSSYAPQAFFPSHAEDMGLDRKKEGMLFVAIAGFSDLGGRVLTTAIADQKWLNRPRFLGSILITHGIFACFIPLLNTFPTFAAYCVIYGASGGIIFAISNTILIDYIGVEKLPQGLGLMLFFNGFAAAGTFLFIGFFREFIGSYNPAFVMNGICLVVSGLLFCAEACIKYEKQTR